MLPELTNIIDKALEGDSIDNFHGNMGRLTGKSLKLMREELGLDI